MIREQWRSLMASTFKGRGIPDSRLRELLDQWEGEDPQTLAEAKVSGPAASFLWQHFRGGLVPPVAVPGDAVGPSRGRLRIQMRHQCCVGRA